MWISKFQVFANFKIEGSEISRNLKFLTVPVLCHDNDMHDIVRKRGARARGLVFRTRFRTSNHARNASRSLRSKFGEIENL